MEEQYTKKELQEIIKAIKANLKSINKYNKAENFENEIRWKKQLQLCIDKIEQIKAQESELKKAFKESKIENELQSIPHLTQKLSYLKSALHFNKQEQVALNFMEENAGVTDTYSLHFGTGMHLRSAGRCLSILNKKGIIRPKNAILSPYGRNVTQYEIVSEILSYRGE